MEIQKISFGIPKILIEKKLEATIIAILLMTAFAATYQGQKPLTEVQQRTLEVDELMKTVSSSSSQQELVSAQGQLRLHAIWANRQPQTKEIKEFLVFLEDCNQQLISFSKK